MSILTIDSTIEDVQKLLVDNDKDFLGQIKSLNKGKTIIEGKQILTKDFHFFMALMLQGVGKDKCRSNFINIAYPDKDKSTNTSDTTWRRNAGIFVNDKAGNIDPILNGKLANISKDTKLEAFENGSWYDLLDDKNNPIFYTINPNTGNGETRVKEKIRQIVNFLVKDVQVTSNGGFEFMADLYTLLLSNKQMILNGAPGTGKTWMVRKIVKEKCNNNEQQYKFVQFHPSYDYSDFVEGLRPVVIKGKEEPTFVRMDGVFKEFCRYIVEEDDKNNPYYFIVDEINRADLAKVFGELMFGLEESYRGKHNPIQTQYKNLVTYKIVTKSDTANTMYAQDDIGKAVPIEDDVFKDGFFIPENLFFIGTMNDIDRSVDSMDFALRRRFQWVDIKANEIMESSLRSILSRDNQDKDSEIGGRIADAAKKIIAMNNIISSGEYKFGLSEAYHIGPAYFKKLKTSSDEELKASLQSIFDTNITSILKEYTRGRKSEDINVWINRCREALLEEN